MDSSWLKSRPCRYSSDLLLERKARPNSLSVDFDENREENSAADSSRRLVRSPRRPSTFPLDFLRSDSIANFLKERQMNGAIRSFSLAVSICSTFPATVNLPLAFSSTESNRNWTELESACLSLKDKQKCKEKEKNKLIFLVRAVAKRCDVIIHVLVQ